MNLQPHTADLHKIDLELLAQYCQIENWSASAQSGMFTLGDLSAYIHGLDATCCGMLPLVNSYAAEDRDRIIEVFDTVCAHSSTFCYSTTIVNSDRFEQPILVMGESVIENVAKAVITGIFIFPRLHNEPLQKFRQ